MFGEIVNRIAAVGEADALFADRRDRRVAGDDSFEAASFFLCHGMILRFDNAMNSIRKSSHASSDDSNFLNLWNESVQAVQTVQTVSERLLLTDSDCWLLTVRRPIR